MTAQASGRVDIPNEAGLHARPSALVVKCAAAFSAEIFIRNEANGVEAEAKKLMEVMMLAAPRGTSLLIEAEGPDAQAAVDSLIALVASGFDES